MIHALKFYKTQDMLIIIYNVWVWICNGDFQNELYKEFRFEIFS